MPEKFDWSRSVGTFIFNEKNKRNFLLSLFRMYSQLPFDACVTNFVKVYNDVFVKEASGTSNKYQMMEL